MSLPLTLSLRNGLRLTLTGNPDCHVVANFLKAALIHFKRQRDVARVTAYHGGTFRAGGCAIFHPGDADGLYLAPNMWVEAASDAYDQVNKFGRIAAYVPYSVGGGLAKHSS